MILRVPSTISMLLLTVSLVLSQCESGEERAERFYQSGKELLEAGDADRALVEFRNVFKLDPTHEGALQSFAEVQRERGNLRSSTRFFRQLVEQYPGNLSGQKALGELSLEALNWEAAERHVRAAYELAPEDTLVKAMNAALDYRAGILEEDDVKRAQAYELSKEILASEDLKVSRRVVIDQLLTDQKFSSAIEELNKGLEADPNNAEFNELKLRALATLNDQQGVGEQLKVMVERFPENERIRAAMISWFLQQRDLDGAEAFLRQLASGEGEVADQSKVAVVQFLKETQGDDAARAELERLAETEENGDFYRSLLAVLDFETGDREKAMADLEAIVSGAEPSDQTDKMKVTLARLRIATGNNVGARALVEEVLTSDPNQVDALKMKAAWLIEDDAAGEAIATLRNALDQAPRDVEIMTLMAQAHLRDGSRNLAGERLALAVEASNSAPEPSLRYVRFLMEDEQLEIAESVLIDALRRNNQNFQLLGTLGEIYLRQGDWGRAQGVIDSLAELEGDARARNIGNSLRANLLQRQERSDESIAFLQQLIDQGDASSAAVANIVRTHLSNGEVDQAQAYLDDALTDAPEDNVLRFLRAGIHVVQQETDAAEAIYTSILEETPTAINVINAKYALLMRTGKTDDAKAFLESSIEATNGAPALLWIKAGNLEQAGDIDGAIDIYEGLYAQNSNNLVVANNLASLISSHRDDDASLERAFAIAKRLRGADQPAFQDTYGWIAYRRGDYQEAIEHLEPAAAGLPNDPLVQFHLGMTYVALEQNDLAREALTAALEVGKDRDLPQLQVARETLDSLPAQ